MTTQPTQSLPWTPDQERQVWSTALTLIGSQRCLLGALVLTIGSTGLVLGGCTVALAYVLILQGLGLIPALMIGFFAVGMAGVTTGLLVAYRTVRGRMDRLSHS